MSVAFYVAFGPQSWVAFQAFPTEYGMKACIINEKLTFKTTNAYPDSLLERLLEKLPIYLPTYYASLSKAIGEGAFLTAFRKGAYFDNGQ